MKVLPRSQDSFLSGSIDTTLLRGQATVGVALEFLFTNEKFHIHNDHIKCLNSPKAEHFAMLQQTFGWSKMFCGNKQWKTQEDFCTNRSAISSFIEIRKTFSKMLTSTHTHKKNRQILWFYPNWTMNFACFTHNLMTIFTFLKNFFTLISR